MRQGIPMVGGPKHTYIHRRKSERARCMHTSEGVVGHAEEGDAGLVAEDVEDVAVLREAEAGVGVGRQLLEDAAGDGAGVARDGGELGQHDGAARHQRVHDRHGDGDRRDLIRWIWIWIP